MAMPAFPLSSCVPQCQALFNEVKEPCVWGIDRSKVDVPARFAATQMFLYYLQGDLHCKAYRYLVVGIEKIQLIHLIGRFRGQLEKRGCISNRAYMKRGENTHGTLSGCWNMLIEN